MALHRLGRLEAAAAHYAEALRLDPASAEEHNGLGTARAAQGALAEAVACYRQAVQLAPGAVKYHCNLACALSDLGQGATATAEYAAATRLDPAWPAAAARVARALATDPDPRRRYPALAVQLARQACQGA